MKITITSSEQAFTTYRELNLNARDSRDVQNFHMYVSQLENLERLADELSGKMHQPKEEKAFCSRLKAKMYDFVGEKLVNQSLFAVTEEKTIASYGQGLALINLCIEELRCTIATELSTLKKISEEKGESETEVKESTGSSSLDSERESSRNSSSSNSITRNENSTEDYLHLLDADKEKLNALLNKTPSVAQVQSILVERIFVRNDIEKSLSKDKDGSDKDKALELIKKGLIKVEELRNKELQRIQNKNQSAIELKKEKESLQHKLQEEAQKKQQIDIIEKKSRAVRKKKNEFINLYERLKILQSNNPQMLYQLLPSYGNINNCMVLGIQSCKDYGEFKIYLESGKLKDESRSNLNGKALEELKRIEGNLDSIYSILIECVESLPSASVLESLEAEIALRATKNNREIKSVVLDQVEKESTQTDVAQVLSENIGIEVPAKVLSEATPSEVNAPTVLSEDHKHTEIVRTIKFGNVHVVTTDKKQITSTIDEYEEKKASKHKHKKKAYQIQNQDQKQVSTMFIKAEIRDVSDAIFFVKKNIDFSIGFISREIEGFESWIGYVPKDSPIKKEYEDMQILLRVIKNRQWVNLKELLTKNSTLLNMIASPVYRENYQLWLEDKVGYEKIVSEDVAFNYASFPQQDNTMSSQVDSTHSNQGPNSVIPTLDTKHIRRDAILVTSSGSSATQSRVPVPTNPLPSSGSRGSTNGAILVRPSTLRTVIASLPSGTNVEGRTSRQSLIRQGDLTPILRHNPSQGSTIQSSDHVISRSDTKHIEGNAISVTSSRSSATQNPGFRLDIKTAQKAAESTTKDIVKVLENRAYSYVKNIYRHQKTKDKLEAITSLHETATCISDILAGEAKKDGGGKFTLGDIKDLIKFFKTELAKFEILTTESRANCFTFLSTSQRRQTEGERIFFRLMYRMLTQLHKNLGIPENLTQPESLVQNNRMENKYESEDYRKHKEGVRLPTKYDQIKNGKDGTYVRLMDKRKQGHTTNSKVNPNGYTLLKNPS